jgi:23S rRNA (uracil1939-C5)-methyltransferase
VKAELVIDRLSQLGDGVATLEGRSVFVDRAFPGERVIAEVSEQGKVLRGTTVELLRHSPRRRPATCPIANRCGGCDWLELDEAAQRESKQEIVLSALEHIAGIQRSSIEVRAQVPSTREMGYRRRAVLHLTGGALAFNARRSHDRVPVDACPALVPELALLPGRLTPLLSSIAKDCESVNLLAEEAVAFAAFLRKPITDRHRKAIENAVRAVGARGALLVPPTGAPWRTGDPELRTPAPLRPEITLFSRPDAFSQANRAMAPALVAIALEYARLRPEDRSLELYSGNGAFTFALAARCREVYAIESSGVAVELATRSARQHAVANVRFAQGDALKVARGLADEGQGFDVVLADPPRTGASGLSRVAEGLRVERVVYVACDAGALARDAADLRRAGFKPTSLTLVDMFPQTHHIEAVMAFHRS